MIREGSRMIAGEATMKSDEIGGASISPSGRLRVTPNAISVCLFGPTGIPFRMSDLENPSSPKGSSFETDVILCDDEKNNRDILSVRQDLITAKVLSETTLQSSDDSTEVTKGNAHHSDSNKQEPISHDNILEMNVGSDSSTISYSPEQPQHSDYVPTRPVKLLNGTKKTLFNEMPPPDDNVATSNTKSILSVTVAGKNSKAKLANNAKKSPHKININDLRRHASQGIPDSPFYPVSYSSSLRAIAWRVLLGYLPVDTSKWATVLKRDRALYRNLVNELFLSTDDIGVLLCSTNEKKSREKFHSWQVMSIENEDDPPTEIVSPSSNVIIRLSTSGGAQSLLGLDGLGGGDGVELLSVDQVNSATMNESSSPIMLDIIKELESIRLDKNDDHVAESPIDSAPDSSNTLDTLPSQVRDQWKKSSRSMSLTDGASSVENIVHDLLNSLLIVDDDGSRYPLHGRSTDITDPKFICKDTKWTQFFENTRLLDEIRKDVDR